MIDTSVLDGKVILITGGTGSFGHCFARYALQNAHPRKIIVYSRDEYKQFVMSNEEPFKERSDVIRFFIGDVRDRDRLRRALEGVDYCVHAAALKQVPACEYNPNEAVRTNINGAMNVIDACLDTGVKKVVALSTDISIVRYGNVAGSRGSVIPFFKQLAESGAKTLPITDYRMTRFWISLEQGVELVIRALRDAKGGETFISKIPSFYVKDLAAAMYPDIPTVEVGIRPGEKLHEVMVTAEDAPFTLEFDENYIVYPQVTFNERQVRDLTGTPVEDGFVYSSGTNREWMSVEEIRRRLPEAGI